MRTPWHGRYFGMRHWHAMVAEQAMRIRELEDHLARMQQRDRRQRNEIRLLRHKLYGQQHFDAAPVEEP